MNPANSVQLIGTLAAHPVYVTTERAADLTTFIMLTQRKPRGRSEVTRTDEHRCVVWGPAALQLHRYLEKGSRLAVIGELCYSKFRDASGKEREIAEVHVSDFTLLGGGRKRDHEKQGLLTAYPSETDPTAIAAESSRMHFGRTGKGPRN